MSRTVRARLASLILVIVTAALVAACGGAKGSTAGAAGTSGKAAKAFPASTLAFVDGNVDVSSGAWQQVSKLGARFPGWAKVVAQLQSKLGSTDSSGTSFTQDVKPWLGDEAAVGVLGITLGAGGKPMPQVVGYVASKDDARLKAALAAKGRATAAGSYRSYAEYHAGSAFAAVGDGALLVASDEASLRHVIDTRSGSGSLADLQTFKDTLAKLPDSNIVVGYLDGAKAAQLADLGFAMAARSSNSAARSGAVTGAQLAKLTRGLHALRSIGFSLGADDHGFRLRVVELIAPGKAASLGLDAPFTPALAARVPSGAVAYLGFRDLGPKLQQGLASFATSAPQVAKAIQQVEAMTGVSLKGDLIPLLSGEHALFLTGGAPVGGGAILQPADAARGAATMRRLTAALAKQAAGSPSAPTFAPIPGVDGEQATLGGANPGKLSWRHDGDLLTLGFNAVDAPPSSGLGTADAYRSLLGDAGAPDRVSAIGYLDVPGVVDLVRAQAKHPVPPEALANLAPLTGVVAWGTIDGDVASSDVYVGVH